MQLIGRCVFACAELSLVIQTVVRFLAAYQHQADAVGRADGHGIGVRQPALAHTILARSRIGEYAGTAGFGFYDGQAQWAGDCIALRMIQRQFGDDATIAADHCFGSSTA